MGSVVLDGAVTQMMPVEIKLAEQFTKYPGGRFRGMGPHSGEEFRDDVLAPALARAIAGGGDLVVHLDGTAGYPASFLEEAFGGLVRKGQFPVAELTGRIKVTATDPRYRSYKQLAEKYLAEAIQRLN